MRKTVKNGRRDSRDIRPEYQFDYSKAKPNRYSSRMKQPVIAIVLEPAPPAPPPRQPHERARCGAAAPRRALHQYQRPGNTRPTKKKTQNADPPLGAPRCGGNPPATG